MIQKNPFLKYVMKDKKEDVFHSSAYAKAQSGATIGAASSESYQVRVNLNQNRTAVRGYKDSEIMTGIKDNGPRAKAYTPPEKIDGVRVGAPVGTNKSATAATNRAMMPAKNPGISVKR